MISRIPSDPGRASTQAIRAFSVLDFLRAKEVREMETMENINRHPQNGKPHPLTQATSRQNEKNRCKMKINTVFLIDLT